MPGRGRYYGDRFIPARSSMNFDVANYLLVGSRRGGDNMQQQPTSLSTEDHRNRLSEALMINTRRVLSFWWSEPTTDNFEQELYEGQGKRRKRRYISKSANKTLDAPEILDDYHLNLIDWSSGNNVLAIALRDRVCLWDASNGSDSKLFSVDEETGPVTSVSWAPNGQHIAVGMNNSIVELWDMTSNQKVGIGLESARFLGMNIF
eukprot:TRINITY_DN37630_c0_g1_i1.p1 TRINITY_DN37630_c0_g1~~TRINITY_DN37630_c0_g1_i1.p1  ORF type:complete len:205 (-),score=36.77 TRINITY_DN37630_c0_g1_i1:352-966(-)